MIENILISIFELITYPLILLVDKYRKTGNLLNLINLNGGITKENESAWLMACGCDDYEKFYKIRRWNNNTSIEEISVKKFLEMWCSNSIETLFKLEGCFVLDEDSDIPTIELFVDYETEEYKNKVINYFEKDSLKKNANHVVVAYSTETVFSGGE